MRSDSHNILRLSLLLGLLAATAHAADAARPAEATPVLAALRGQWAFLNSSTAFCAEKVPALKADLQSARAHAEAQMWKAEAIILEEVEDNPGRFQRHLDKYMKNWTAYAALQAESMKRQEPGMACPVLLSNWQTADVELLLEDWHLFIERSASSGPEAN